MSRIPDPSICLCMMVKNEAHIIRRALESALPYIDYWVICDTGSNDDTPAVIANVMQDKPGQLYHTTWKNFGRNRSEVLERARSHADYLLIMDADMTLNVKAPFRQKLQHDFYEIRYEGSLDYSQPMLISSRHQWRYIGVTHEYLHAETATEWAFLPEISLTHYGDGGCRSDKFGRDVQLLTEALQTEPHNERYMFYLAQSYSDLKLYEQALYWYEKRIEKEGWDEERWYARLQRADMLRLLGRAWTDVQAAYMAAFDARPWRLETLHAMARYYRENHQYLQGYCMASLALQDPPYPANDKLFIDKPVYDYQLLFEFMVCAIACGRVSEAITAANRLLWQNSLPPGIYEYTIHARKMAFELIHGKGRDMDETRNRLVVIVPFHNPGRFLGECVSSMLMQDYPNAQVIFIDDASTDASAHFEPPQALDAVLLRNQQKMGSAYNIYQAITTWCRPDDIVVCLDGDDQLACHNALSIINEQYVRYDCWTMYGQYMDADGCLGVSAPYASPKDFATLRQGWRVSHIRTFRAGLFMAIADQDPEYNCLKNSEGEWLQSATDTAIMFPLMEMAGFYRVIFNETILYRYNNRNPASHHFVNRPAQLRNFEWVCSMRPFARVAGYYPSTILTDVL
ncbi:glycosyltransferase [Chitinophaga sp. LS1]|uniref:glycosyltransferase n=1 Tax=Chitinophaga sp. LS1 TaxID=3051176 RepID=UPI002AABE840|nr:glycosyltransferase [Chitinophaga sp. LS1]WPV64827.1 glycosyltransferase [Chitinophaga sp. LS1]